jgi:hypothetical protein
MTESGGPRYGSSPWMDMAFDDVAATTVGAIARR